ncbi:ApcC hetero-tetramer Cut9-Hcn1 [Gigaspora margarita]|uniref:ApcC hetero-tetramer Cut9-Hcn1 n=1 Tax=Gigaspora margarita TaxID=4874 RepID=A0A8H3XG60_GIGMA|nr:ApcC hetero-tetramer Cut9-Hcn1 [Gigaspora margarita]
MDSHCGPAWVGFGHTFAIESEHDQAITVYSTTAKLYPGSHLSTLFIGMQHLQAKNLLSVEEYLLTSSQICESDPLVLNELGMPNQLIPLRMHLRNLVVSMSSPNADALSALGYIYHVKEKFEEYYHEVLYQFYIWIINNIESTLGICPYDPITHDLFEFMS